MSKKSEEGNEQKKEGIGRLDFYETVEHFQKGYENAQATTRFMDTKASAVIAVVPVIIAALIQSFAWFKGWVYWSQTVDVVGAWVPSIIWFYILIYGVWIVFSVWMTLTNAFCALLPRDTGDSGSSILFPFNLNVFVRSKKNVNDMAARINLFVEGATRADVHSDYKRQLLRMSDIVAIKMSCVQRSVRHLQLLLKLSLIFVVLLVIQVFYSVAIINIAAWPSFVLIFWAK